MIAHPSRSPLARLRRHIAIAALASTTAVVAGCGSSAGPGGKRHVASSAEAQNEELDARREAMDERYVIGPTATRKMGYRIDWQFLGAGPEVEQIVVASDSVYTLDGYNFLTRVQLDDGQRLWRIPVADNNADILGITEVAALGHVFLTTGGSMLVLDASTGTQVGRQDLTKIASTAPLQLGQYFLYGSRNGQVVWYSYSVAFPWRSYQISPSIKLQPVLADGAIIAVGSDRRICVFNARTASQLWNKTLLDDIVSRPVAGNGAVFCSSLDQHVWGFDLGNGRNIWRYLTESPLETAPTLIGDRVFQHVPTEGLVCLEALPIEAPDGVVLWKAPESTGQVITMHGSHLIAWDADHKRLELIDSARGHIIDSMTLPQVDRVIATSTTSGDIFASSSDGRLVRLVPRN